MIHADSIERAVLDAVGMTLLDPAELTEQLTRLVEAEVKSAPATGLEDLKRQREQVQKQTQRVLMLAADDETLADAKDLLESLKAKRRHLNEQIAAAESRASSASLDVGRTVAALQEKTKTMLENPSALSTHQLRESLAALVGKVVADLETKSIEVHLRLPPWWLKTAPAASESMRLVSTSASSGGYETHTADGWSLGVVFCTTEHPPKSAQKPCYTCRRKVG